MSVKSFILNFGKYKNKSFYDVYKENPQYINYLIGLDNFIYKEEFKKLIDEFEELFPNIREEIIENKNKHKEKMRKKNYRDNSLVLNFGKYEGKTVKELFIEDYRYLKWFVYLDNLFNKELYQHEFFELSNIEKFKQFIPKTRIKKQLRIIPEKEEKINK